MTTHRKDWTAALQQLKERNPELIRTAVLNCWSEGYGISFIARALGETEAFVEQLLEGEFK